MEYPLGRMEGALPTVYVLEFRFNGGYMEIARNSLDDLLAALYPFILENGVWNKDSRKGPNLDVVGVTLRLSDPRARLSRSRGRGRPFSALGELLWYLSGSDEAAFISPYIGYYAKPEQLDPVPDAYGPRLLGLMPDRGFGENQLTAVIEALGERPGTRRAIIQLYDSTDRAREGDIPCTTALQFHARDGALHMTATMRSNDAWLGLPHDLFCFTMLQEMMATRLGLKLGEYVHFASSMHVYKSSQRGVRGYLAEGFQRIAPMPPMPPGDPFSAITSLLEVDRQARAQCAVEFSGLGLAPYYEDLARLVFANFHQGESARLDEALDGLHHREYHTYIDERRDIAPQRRQREV